jgi:predicted metal-dependent enzyme (double-stranded beta helix superfamily)
VSGTASIAERRRAAVGEAVAEIRGIEAHRGVSRESLSSIKEVLLNLAAKRNLFPEEDFPSATGEPLLYLLSEENDHRFALYLSTGLPGRSSPPHNHTTWAVIVGIEGEEENRIYDRLDDGSVPGKGSVEVREKFVVKRGTGICFLPDDIHSIHVVSDVPTRNFHMYGRSVEHLPERIRFDMDKGTYSVYPASPGIRK